MIDLEWNPLKFVSTFVHEDLSTGMSEIGYTEKSYTFDSAKKLLKKGFQITKYNYAVDKTSKVTVKLSDKENFIKIKRKGKPE
jgi:hypothetical protein